MDPHLAQHYDHCQYCLTDPAKERILIRNRCGHVLSSEFMVVRVHGRIRAALRSVFMRYSQPVQCSFFAFDFRGDGQESFLLREGKMRLHTAYRTKIGHPPEAVPTLRTTAPRVIEFAARTVRRKLDCVATDASLIAAWLAVLKSFTVSSPVMIYLSISGTHVIQSKYIKSFAF